MLFRYRQRRADLITTEKADLRQAEVQDFRVASLRYKDVGRFDVTMNDAFGMSGVERVGDFDSEIKHSIQFQGPADLIPLKIPSINWLPAEFRGSIRHGHSDS